MIECVRKLHKVLLLLKKNLNIQDVYLMNTIWYFHMQVDMITEMKFCMIIWHTMFMFY